MALKIKWRDRELEELAKRADAVARRDISRIYGNATRVMGITLQEEVVKHTPIGVTGMLRASISRTFSRTATGWQSDVFSAGVKYAPAVETGRAPGKMPPYRALVRWVHLMVRRGRLSLAKGMKVQRLAYLIARKIGRKGTKGAGMFRKAEKSAMKELNRIIGRARIAVARRLAGHSG